MAEEELNIQGKVVYKIPVANAWKFRELYLNMQVEQHL